MTARKRFDAAPILEGLKDFQRNTVAHVMDRFYGDRADHPVPGRRRDRPGQEHRRARRHRAA